MTNLDRRIEGLSLEKRALLERRLLDRRKTTAEDSIPRREPGARTPLSFSQQRLWFLDQLSPGSYTYNAALAMRVKGDLDVEALRAALARVVERHEALRTVFRLDGGQPLQVVLDEWSFELPVLDLHGAPEAEQGSEVERLLRERARRPFALDSDLMLRATLLQLGTDDYVLSLEEHHIAFDGWSDAIMFREVTESYEAALSGRDPELPELPIQYGDFAAWQQQRLQGTLLEDLQAYWRQQLAGAPSVVRLPTDFPRPAVQTFDGEHLHFSLPGRFADGVRRLSRDEGVTPYMTLLACFAALVYRVTGQDDVLVGTPIANRSRVELEHLIGFFSNTLCMRIRLGGNPTVRELLARVRETALGGYAHQDLPFEKVVEAVRPARDAGVNPLFQINFRATSGPPTTLRLPGLEVTPLTLDIGFSRFDLALELQLRDDAVEGYFEYNTRLSRRESAARLVQAFERLLEGALERPDTRLLALELPSETVAAARGPQQGPSIKSFRNRAATAATISTTDS